MNCESLWRIRIVSQWKGAAYTVCMYKASRCTHHGSIYAHMYTSLLSEVIWCTVCVYPKPRIYVHTFIRYVRMSLAVLLQTNRMPVPGHMYYVQYAQYIPVKGLASAITSSVQNWPITYSVCNFMKGNALM